MLDKMLNFLKEYVDGIDYSIEKTGKYKTLSNALNVLIEGDIFDKDTLRKELSIEIERIIHQREFEHLLDKSRVEYEPILCD